MSFSSLVLRSGVASLACLSFIAQPVAALTSNTYLLQTEYSGASFFDGFDFFTVRPPRFSLRAVYGTHPDAPLRGLTRPMVSSRKVSAPLHTALLADAEVVTWTKLQLRLTR